MVFRGVQRFDLFNISFARSRLALLKSKPLTIQTVNYLHKRPNPSYVSGSANIPLLGLTVGNVVDVAVEKYADRDAIVSCHQNITKTFYQVKEEVDKLAAGFIALGLKKGDRIGIWSPNYYEWYLTQFATAKAGLILVNVNPAYRTHELLYCLAKSGARAIVSAENFKTQDYYQMLAEIIPSLSGSKQGEIRSEKVPNMRHVIMLSDKTYGGTLKFTDVLNAGGNDAKKELELLQEKIQFDDPVNIQFTSGTTGSPKGATLSHHNVVNNAHIFGRRFGYHVHDRDRIALQVPLYHCLGCVVGALSSVIFGNCLVLPGPSFNAKDTAKAIEKERCTVVYGTPTMFIDILSLPDLETYQFNTLRAGLMAGSVCPVEVVNACSRNLNISKMSTPYGCTETSPGITMSNLDDTAKVRATSVGTALEHTEVKIVDSNGHVVPLGTRGDLWVRGYNVMLGYWEDDDKTAEAITKDRWYKTGDLAIMDDTGYVQIVGRIKELVIRGGENIYPREVEEFLHTHPKVSEVQVVGVPDKRLGEELCAWIKLKAGKTATQDELKAFCKGKIAHFKIPRYMMFVDDFPMTVTGKIQKYIIREESIKQFGL